MGKQDVASVAKISGGLRKACRVRYASLGDTSCVLVCQMYWYVRRTGMSDVLVCQMYWYVRCIGMSDVLVCQMRHTNIYRRRNAKTCIGFAPDVALMLLTI